MFVSYRENYILVYMKLNTDILNLFKIESNNIVPAKGRILIAAPFLVEPDFGRSVILLIEHTEQGSMGLVFNRIMRYNLNHLIKGLDELEPIPLYKGGPIGMDTLFYLHDLEDVPNSLSMGNGIYLNGDFNAVKEYLLSGRYKEGKVRFFLGYSGWDSKQIIDELKTNTWVVAEENLTFLLDEPIDRLWKSTLERLGYKYKTWSKFPQIPALN